MEQWKNFQLTVKAGGYKVSGKTFCPRPTAIANPKGIFALITALSAFGLFAFTALGIEVGRWYIARAELSKSVDAAALIGAKNIGNPYLDAADLMAEIGQANFTPGFLGTEGQAQVVGTVLSEGRVSVSATTNLLNTITQVMESQAGVEEGTLDKVLIGSTGLAQQRDVEILMVLDRSGSMGSAMGNLKNAATSFVDFFTPTEDNDKFGLISFASGVVVDFPMGHYFVTPMQNAINAMSANGGTNTEDALDQADGPSGLSDQTGVPGDQKVQQFLIFFSDGNPTAFRGTFTRNGTDYDAVGYAADWDIDLMNPNVPMQYIGVKQYKTGDGLSTGSTVCSSGGSPYYNTKWHVLDDSTYGVTGYSPFLSVYYTDLLQTSNPEICNLSKSRGKDYVEAITKQMAIDHAQEVKDKGVKIYTIGLGSVDQTFLAAIASGPGFEYYTVDSNELTNLFQKVATNIKLRLLE